MISELDIISVNSWKKVNGEGRESGRWKVESTNGKNQPRMHTNDHELQFTIHHSLLLSVSIRVNKWLMGKGGYKFYMQAFLRALCVLRGEQGFTDGRFLSVHYPDDMICPENKRGGLRCPH